MKAQEILDSRIEKLSPLEVEVLRSIRNFDVWFKAWCIFITTSQGCDYLQDELKKILPMLKKGYLTVTEEYE